MHIVCIFVEIAISLPVGSFSWRSHHFQNDHAFIIFFSPPLEHFAQLAYERMNNNHLKERNSQIVTISEIVVYVIYSNK